MQTELKSSYTSLVCFKSNLITQQSLVDFVWFNPAKHFTKNFTINPNNRKNETNDRIR